MAIKWTLQSIKEALFNLHGDKYEYIGFNNYSNLWQQISVRCKKHDLIFNPYLSNHLKKGTGCPECGKDKSKNSNKKAKIKADTVIAKFNKIHNNRYKYIIESYVDSITPMKMICDIHGEFLQKPSNHNNGKGCPKCGKESMIKKLRFTNEEISNILSEKHSYAFDVNTYAGTKQIMKFICPEHGEFWQKPMNQLRMDSGCPICSTSKAEKELISLYPFFKHNDRTIINPLEIDLLDHTHNFGIEFNGNIWHSFGKTFPNNSENIIKNKHIVKSNKMEELGYQLFHILDIDWENPIKKEIWKSVIDSKIGKTEKIFARKTKIIDLTLNRDIVKSFLTNNHLQGFCNYKFAYGLVNKFESLVAIMTFGKPIEDSSEWEIKRFCNIRNYTVVGGASKLLKHFEKTHKPTSILSYAKRDWSIGNVYEKLGFTLIDKTEPSKFYIKDNIKFSRQKFQKHKLNDRINDGLLNHLNGVSTQDILFNNGYRVFFDSGNLKYIKRLT